MRKGTGVNSPPKTPAVRDTRRSLRLAAGAAGVVVVALLVWLLVLPSGKAGAAMATAPVTRGPLVISVSESGTIQNLERKVVKNEVEGSATILFLVPEGSHVTKGDLLVELDSSRLVDDRTSQQIVVMNAEAAFIRARENLEVVKSQTASDVDKADLAARFAEQDLDKYEKGDYPRELQKAEADINIAEEELKRANDKLEWSKKFAAEKYITDTELQADILAAHRSQIELDLARSALDLLKQYTHQRNLDQLSSDVEQAKEALGRTKRKAAADVVQADADLKAKQSEYERQQSKLTKLDEQIVKCRILAPVDGMVVYASTGDSNRFRTSQPLDEGQQVRERQELIYLPTDQKMKAEVKIHESSLRKVKVGMPVRITVDALPGQTFWGKVSLIALLPDAQSAFLNPDLKVYNTQIDIQGDAATMRAGMSCNAEIIVEQFPEALSVPVQSVVRVGGNSVVYVPGPDGPVMREVEVGLDNNRMIRVLSGLTEGQQVLLAPPLAASAVTDEMGGKPVEIPDALMAAAIGAAAPAPAPAAAAGEVAMPDFRSLSPEDRKKWLESLTPEQREKLKERFGGGGRRGRPPESGGDGSEGR